MNITSTQFTIGQVVRHCDLSFRGVIVDVDAEFASNEEWWDSIPEEKRPRRDQPFYHVLAEADTRAYHTYVSEQHLLGDDSGEPLQLPQIAEMFGDFRDGAYHLPLRLQN